MKAFLDLAVLGKPEALEKFLPAVESLLPPGAYRDREMEDRIKERSPDSPLRFIRWRRFSDDLIFPIEQIPVAICFREVFLHPGRIVPAPGFPPLLADFFDTNDAVDAFVKNAGLGFAIPYFYNGEAHDYIPDFIVRLKSEPPLHLIIEVKGYDERADIKAQAAQKWVDAVSADGAYGRWAYALARKPSEVKQLLADAARI